MSKGLRKKAIFLTDIPDDYVEDEGGNIFLFGGQGVARVQPAPKWHAEALNRSNDPMHNYPRFREIRWYVDLDTAPEVGSLGRVGSIDLAVATAGRRGADWSPGVPGELAGQGA